MSSRQTRLTDNMPSTTTWVAGALAGCWWVCFTHSPGSLVSGFPADHISLQEKREETEFASKHSRLPHTSFCSSRLNANPDSGEPPQLCLHSPDLFGILWLVVVHIGGENLKMYDKIELKFVNFLNKVINQLPNYKLAYSPVFTVLD